MAKQEKQNRTGRPVQIYFDEDTFQRLESLSAANGRPVSVEVRRAVLRYLESPERITTGETVPIVVPSPPEPPTPDVPKRGRKKKEG